MKKIYDFMFEENTYDTTKAKDILKKTDYFQRILQKVVFWLLLLVWFISIFDSFFAVGLGRPTSITAGFIYMTIVMICYGLYLCISRVLTMAIGALIRLVELNEGQKGS
ncbi:hypothetical protein MCEGE14_02774 [Burkholderiaceae bacterium]